MKTQLTMTCLLATVLASGVGCHGPVAHNLPPADRVLHPGPGVGGPGPGVLPPTVSMPPGMMPASQVAFSGGSGMQVAWDVGGQGYFDSEPLVLPANQNFHQAAIYRLKLTNIPGRPGVELYPTLEVAPATPRTSAFLAHAAIPVQFNDEDFDQVVNGNYVTKVIYLPDPEFQDLALADVRTLVSTRLEVGVDPIEEAERRGSIMAVVRIGSKDLEMPGGVNEGAIMPASYSAAAAGGMPYVGGSGTMPMGVPTGAFAPQAIPPGMIAGVNGPQWGMPSSGTPIGLPGPPHVPLGAPAGLTRHVMKNKTRVHMPPPVDTLKVTVKQRPGMNYPQPVRSVHISETNRAPLGGGHPNGNGPFGGGVICEDCP